jgi:hypothetical protein
MELHLSNKISLKLKNLLKKSVFLPIYYDSENSGFD